MTENREMYGEAAAAYAAHSAANFMNVRYERPAMYAAIGDVAGKRVLDAGCAGGEYAAHFLAGGANVTALDASPAMIDIVRERFGDAVNARCHNLAEPIGWLDDASFDIVCSSLTLHYVRDWNVPLREFYRLLKPGARAVISTHHPQMIPVANYFETQLIEDTWSVGGADRRVTFYHRPLQAMIAPVSQAGFVLRRVIEPQLPERSPDVTEEWYERLNHKPWFIIFDAEKTLQ
jgi:ubiquinone/menaquinone biosynthesis C-methylase UbiE